MTTIQERVAVLEEQNRVVLTRLDHIDLCVDNLKRVVWQAAGAVAILVMIVQMFSK